MATDAGINISATLDISQMQQEVKKYERDLLRAQNVSEKAGKVIGESLLSGTEDLTQNIKIQREIIKSLEDQYKQAQAAVNKAAPGSAKVKLQGELNAVRKELDGEKESLSQLVNAQEQYKQGASSLRTQLMNIRNEMGRLALQGKENTDEYKKQEAELQRLGTVYRKLQREQQALTTGGTQWAGIISGIQGVAGAFAAGQGAVGLFVTDNERLAEIQTKLQSILAVTIGLQQVSNTLHETSAFRITTVRKVTDMWSAANTKLATALGWSNAAAKVLMGTLTLGLSVAIGAIIYAINKWNTKQEELKQKQKEAREEQEKFNKAIADTAAVTLTSFRKLQTQWNSLGGDIKKQTEFVKEHKGEFEKLGIAINDINDADNLFVKNQEAFVNSVMARAKAAAAMELATEKYKQALLKQIEAEEVAQKGNEETKKEAFKIARNKDIGNYIAGVGSSSSQSSQESYTKALNRLNAEASNKLKTEAKALEDQMSNLIKIQTDETNKANQTLLSAGLNTFTKGIIKSQTDLSDAIIANQLKLQEDQIKLMREGKAKELAEAKLAFDRDMAQIDQEQKKREDAYKKAKKTMPAEEAQTFETRRETSQLLYSQSTMGIEIKYAQQLTEIYKNLGNVFLSEESKKTRAVEERYRKMREEVLESFSAGDFGLFDLMKINVQINNAEAYEQMQDLVDAFGTTQDKITKIQQNAQEARDKAIKSNRQDLLPQINQQEQKDISKIELDELMNSDDWVNLFQNLDVLSQKKIHEIIDKINEQLKNADLSPIDFKIVMDQLDKAAETASSKNPFTALARSVPKLKTALATAKKAWEDYEKAKGTPAEAVARVAAEQAQIEADKDRLTVWQDAQKGAADFSNAMGAVGDMLGQFGVEVPQEMEGVMGAMDAFASMDLTKPFSIVTGAIQGVASLIGGLFGAKSHLIPQKVFDQYDAFIDVLDKVIDREKELIETATGAQAVMAGDDALKAIEKQEDATRRLAKAYLASREKGKKSYGVRTERELRGYKDEIEAAGFNWKELYGSGRMEGFFDMSAEQIKEFQKALPEVWAKLDDKTKEYLETIVEAGEKTEEVEAALKEAATGISFDSLRGELLDFLNDMDSTFDDVAGNFQDTMTNAINRVIASQMDGRLKEWYEEFSKAMEDDVLSEAEREDLKRKYENIYADALREREQAYSIAGIKPETTIQQEASSKGFQAMSQDTGNELNGRFTAIQEYTSQINDKMSDMGIKMGTLGDLMKNIEPRLIEMRNINDETRSIIMSSNNYLASIDKNTKVLFDVSDKLDKVVKNTSKL